MREILFRGKHTYTGDWVYGAYCHYDSIVDNGKFVKVIPETVGQYTGLKDENGNKIFEGDILKFLSFKLYKVYFDKAEARFQMTGYDDEYAFHKCVSFCEIVGNIHDNPELTDNGWKIR